MPHYRTVSLTLEADGYVATCDTCGWLRWEQTKAAAAEQGTAHRCRKGDPCLLCRRAYRLGEGAPPRPRTGAPAHPECRHYLSDAGRAARLDAIAAAKAATTRDHRQ